MDNESYVNYLLPYKRSEYVIEVFNSLKQLLGINEFKRLFVTDNGTEFSNPESIEMDINTGEIISNVFYCDPNCSWQKGSIEKIMSILDIFYLKELPSLG